MEKGLTLIHTILTLYKLAVGKLYAHTHNIKLKATRIRVFTLWVYTSRCEHKIMNRVENKGLGGSKNLEGA